MASIAELGVVFIYLFKNVSSSVKKGTLVPEDTICYLALIILGLISGLIMSEIISLYTTKGKGVNLFNKSLPALIGGFSSDAIFSILQGVIDRIKTIFIPSETSIKAISLLFVVEKTNNTFSKLQKTNTI